MKASLYSEPYCFFFFFLSLSIIFFRVFIIVKYSLLRKLLCTWYPNCHPLGCELLYMPGCRNSFQLEWEINSGILKSLHWMLHMSKQWENDSCLHHVLHSPGEATKKILFLQIWSAWRTNFLYFEFLILIKLDSHFG